MSSKHIYFDIAATTPIDSNVIEAMHHANTTYFGNPSSVHYFGQKAHNVIEKCRKNISDYLGCHSSEIIFTSGGTESNNLALAGILNKGEHLITSSYEHPSILKVADNLEKNGIEVTYVKPNRFGIINPEDILKNIQKNTKLVSIMYVNNELGTINSVEDIGDVCKKNNILFHTDAVQYIGKSKLDIKAINVDLLSIGAHKFYGPKGVGALYIKKGLLINPISFGGGQENALRPGTGTPSLIIGMTEALKVACKNLENNSKHIAKLEKLLISELNKTKIKFRINGSPRIPGFINITFNNFDGQNLLMNLDMNGIAISFGSACASGSTKASSALIDIGMDEKEAKNTVRISIGKFINENDILFLISKITQIISPNFKEKIHV